MIDYDTRVCYSMTGCHGVSFSLSNVAWDQTFIEFSIKIMCCGLLIDISWLVTQSHKYKSFVSYKVGGGVGANLSIWDM